MLKFSSINQIITCFLLAVLSACSSFSMDPPKPASELSTFEFSLIDEELRTACVKGTNVVYMLMADGSLRDEVARILEAFKTGHARFFNWSIGEFKGNYIIAARVGATKNTSKTIIPGNGFYSDFEKGQNFWWVDEWQDQNLLYATLFFKCDQNFENYKLLFPGNEDRFGFENPDLRLMNNASDLYLYDTDSEFLAAKVYAVVDEYFAAGVIYFSRDKLINHHFRAEDGKHCKNGSMIKINENFCTYFDWFYLEGIQTIKSNHKSGKLEYFLLPYEDENYPILGIGSLALPAKKSNAARLNTGLTPLWSFSTQNIKIGDNKYLGIGHIKFYNVEKYQFNSNSNIDIFSKKLHTEFKQKFGNKYIRHYGYTYMMYFYTFSLDEADHVTNMQVSDAFLPLKIDEENLSYVFSLIFPMGLILAPDSSHLYVSAGYGDYSAALMKFDLKEVISLCKHNIQNLNLANYQYKIITLLGDKIRVINNLSELGN